MACETSVSVHTVPSLTHPRLSSALVSLAAGHNRGVRATGGAGRAWWWGGSRGEASSAVRTGSTDGAELAGGGVAGRWIDTERTEALLARVGQGVSRREGVTRVSGKEYPGRDLARLPASLKVLTPAQVMEIDRALEEIGPFGEVRLVKVKGRVRFIQRLESQDLGRPDPLE